MARKTKTAEKTADYVTLQDTIWPEQGICTERDLYVRTQGPVGLSDSRHELRFSTSGMAAFSSWFNLFNAEKWKRECGLEQLCLTLEGEGEFELSVFLAPTDRSWDRVVSEIISFPEDGPLRIDLSHVLKAPYEEGLLFFDLRAMGEGLLTRACWQTTQAPRRVPDLALAVTTFRREAEVARTVDRFNTFLKRSWMKGHVQLIVVDNGQTAEIAQNVHVHLVPNANLGGAGGFTRGLLEARARGASHCLFMDDDASIHMDSLERTYRFLSYAIDPATALAGAMISDQHRWAIWENGALFFSRCLPQHMGTDLRDVDEMVEMENEASRPVPWNFYAGWWYFAFPLDKVEHLAFPFFVRGDDVSFSLVHDFNIVTLNGVVSFQESFTEKESPQTWYLDLRSHLAHHLSLPSLQIGRWRTLKIAVWFFLRNLPRMHYETLSAINLAMEDVMEGPEFFDRNADMAQRRADLKALTQVEAWVPVAERPVTAPVRKKPPNWAVRMLNKVTLNGHFVPFFRVFGRKITVLAANRGHIGYVWGASQITFLNADRSKSYTVSHSKKKMLEQGSRLARNSWRFLRGYKDLNEQYQEAYGRLTSEAYWRRKLDMDG